MFQKITVKSNKEVLFELDAVVYRCLFENTIVHRKQRFTQSLENGVLQLKEFINFTREGEVPYPLFFLEILYVHKIVEEFKKKVYFGVSKEQLSISSRGDFSLADISLILKDITRKQYFLKKSVQHTNEISGRFAKSEKSVAEKANDIRNLIGYDINLVFGINKEKTFDMLDNGLASRNVFISLHIHNFSPQNIPRSLQFSGIAVNDKKCPFLFIKAGDYDSKIELWGRRLFTAALLLSCLLHADCRAVTMDSGCRDLVSNEHYLFAEEFLMPEISFKEEQCTSLIEAEKLSSKYSVSPSAVVMRLYRLNIIGEETKNEFLDELFAKWSVLQKRKGGGKKLKVEKAIVRYNNRKFVSIILQAHEKRAISSKDFKNLLCLKKGENVNLEALRNA